MAKTRPARTQAERNKRQGNRCWKGYEPTPGKKPGTKGSCKPVKSNKSARKRSAHR
ncbi:MAG TPA: hypothetical protein VF669_20160 [Tepidisphaeraceae bacterium]|jgi:hypothetical protein